MNAILADVAAKLRVAKKVLITTHRGPDGDGVGSMLAFAALCRANNVEATLHTSDPVPRNLKWLPGVKTWVRKLKPASRYDVTVVMDCGDPQLLGKSFPKPEVSGDVLVLDHHANARPFGDLFVSAPEAAATGVLVARLAEELDWQLDYDSALTIFVALVSDTGSFRYSNTNAEALSLAARLVENHGVDPGLIHRKLEERVPLRRYRLLAHVLSNIELTHDDQIAFMTVTQETIDGLKAKWEDTEGLVNYARAIDGVECGVLLSPAKWGGVRVSMRSKGQLIDAGAICHELGGGGHRGAAGCNLKLSLEDARKKVEDVLTQVLPEKPQELPTSPDKPATS